MLTGLLYNLKMCQDVYVFLKHTEYKDNQHHKSVERMSRHLRNRDWHPLLEPECAEQFCGMDTRYWGPTSSPAPWTKLGTKPIYSKKNSWYVAKTPQQDVINNFHSRRKAWVYNKCQQQYSQDCGSREFTWNTISKHRVAVFISNML